MANNIKMTCVKIVFVDYFLLLHNISQFYSRPQSTYLCNTQFQSDLHMRKKEDLMEILGKHLRKTFSCSSGNEKVEKKKS